MKKFVLVSSCVFMLAACRPVEKEPIKIGFIGPLSGEKAAMGTDILHGAEMKLEEVNLTGGIDGRLVELIAEDGHCMGINAANAAQKLIHVDTVVAILGGGCDEETVAAAPMAEESEVVLLSPASGDPGISDAGDFIFRGFPGDELMAKAMANYLKEKGSVKLAMISENADFTTGFRDSLKKNLGEEIFVFDELVEPGTEDFRTLLASLHDIEFDTFVLNTNSPASIALLLQQLRELEFAQLAISNDLGDSVEIPELIGEAGEGMQVINLPVIGEESDFGKLFVADYGAAQADLTWAGYGYDALGILTETIAAVGTDGAAMRDYLYTLDGYDGVVATVSFDENGDAVGIPFVIREIQDGAFVKVADIEMN